MGVRGRRQRGTSCLAVGCAVVLEAHLREALLPQALFVRGVVRAGRAEGARRELRRSAGHGHGHEQALAKRAAHGVGAPTCTGSGAVEGSKAIGRANTRCAGCCRRLLVEVPPYAGEPLPLYEPAYELMVPYAVAGKRAVGAGGD